MEVFKLVKKDDATLPTFSSQPDLVLECSHSGHILILQLKAKGNLLLVGDAFRSMAVLQHRPEDGSLTEIGRDSLTSEVRAAEILELEDHFLACDAAENLYCVKRNTTGSSEEDRTHLDQCGEFGLGDAVNVICRGALTGQPIETESSNLVESSESKAECDIIFSNDYISITGLAPTSNSIVYGTVTGAIGCVLGLNDGSYRFFSAVEKAMKATTVSIGGLSHQRWRRLDSRYRTAPQRGFIDGDLVESFLDLCREDSETICRIVNDELNNFYSVAPTNPDSMDVANTSSTSSATASAAILRSEKVNFAVEDILQRIEDISRLH